MLLIDMHHEHYFNKMLSNSWTTDKEMGLGRTGIRDALKHPSSGL
jgi:hypothetical protein